MDKDDLVAYGVLAFLASLPIVIGGGVYILLDPATFWQRLAALIVGIGLGLATLLLEITGLKLWLA